MTKLPYIKFEVLFYSMVNTKIIFYFIEIKFTNHFLICIQIEFLLMHLLAKMYEFYKINYKLKQNSCFQINGRQKILAYSHIVHIIIIINGISNVKLLFIILIKLVSNLLIAYFCNTKKIQILYSTFHKINGGPNGFIFLFSKNNIPFSCFLSNFINQILGKHISYPLSHTFAPHAKSLSKLECQIFNHSIIFAHHCQSIFLFSVPLMLLLPLLPL